MSIINNLFREVPQDKSLPAMLLVEDNLIAQRITKNLVNLLGFQLDMASTGTEGVALFEPGKYQMILMDIGLPDFDGYEVTRRIRQIEKESGFYVPIIGVSAHALDDARLTAEAGLNEMLSKPLLSEKAKALLVRYGIGIK